MRCDTCAYYDYEGENKKGYCSWYRSYYYPDDRCDHWKEKLSSGSGSGCFLTTACCEYKKLPDDCDELTTLRTFRDGWLQQQPYGPEMIRLYYDDAPAIVEAIRKSGDKDTILNGIFQKITEITAMIKSENYEKAVIEYLLMVYRLKRKFSS